MLKAKDGLLITADLYRKTENVDYIVVCHLSGHSRGEYRQTAQEFLNLGFNVLAPDARSGEIVFGIAKETATRARQKGLPTNFLDAEQDILAAVDFMDSLNYGRGTMLLGSSYSASLALKIAAINPKVSAVLAFSPGEYFKKLSMKKVIGRIAIPVFVTSSRVEALDVQKLTSDLNYSKTHFIPEVDGAHGSMALWKSTKGSDSYWKAMTIFLLANRTKTMAERMGYAKDTKLLIVHADDLGVSHSENEASIRAMETGSVNSASIMVPCPWFTEIANYSKAHPEKDFGLHLTLTSEWKNYKWGPVTSSSLVNSLVNKRGYLYSTVDSLVKAARIQDVQLELRNQIKKALEFGIDVTHLDAHMYAARNTKELLEVYMALGREFKLPVLLTWDEELTRQVNLTDSDVVVDYLYQAIPENYDGGMQKYYVGLLNGLRPGLSCLLVHTAFDDSETQAMTTGYKYWGAAWRGDDYRFFSSDDSKELLQINKITLVTWREVRDKIIRNK